jgi:hypothetical protein
VTGPGEVNADDFDSPWKEVRKLFRFIDWLMALPDDIERAFWSDVLRLEEEHKMPFVTIGERIGIEKGLREGLMRGIELGLKVKFGDGGLSLLDDVRTLTAIDSLQAILTALETAQTLDEVRGLVCSIQAAP